MSKKRSKIQKIKQALADNPFGLLTHSRAKVKADFCQCPANILESDQKFDGQTHFEYDELSTSGLS